jgi:hypothetical protein
MSRSQNRLILLAVSAMLTFALTSLQAQISTTNYTTIICKTNINALTRPITDAQFKKILADNAANGTNGLTNVTVAKDFGIYHPGMSERYDLFQDDQHNKHSFTQLDNGNYMFITEIGAVDSYYYVDKNLDLISAGTAKITDQHITIIPNKDAQAGLNAELNVFAGIADQL